MLGYPPTITQQKYPMSLLSYNRLRTLIDEGVITADPKQVNGSSIDLTLHNLIRREVKYESAKPDSPMIRIARKHNIISEELDIQYFHAGFDENHNQICGYPLVPDEFILASSNEFFNLPDNISAEYKLKSSMARNGLEHLNAGWCDAGWNGSRLTLELKNVTRYHRLLLEEGMPIGQVVFFEHEPVPQDKSYAAVGQYNGQSKVTESKGIR